MGTINDVIPDVTFVTECHPEANGRIPLNGEHAYALRWILDNGRVLEVKMGQKGYDAFTSFIRQMAVDDAIEDAVPIQDLEERK